MEEPEIPTSGQIKQLDVKTARHISSGQVITSLSVAVKELVCLIPWLCNDYEDCVMMLEWIIILLVLLGKTNAIKY